MLDEFSIYLLIDLLEVIMIWISSFFSCALTLLLFLPYCLSPLLKSFGSHRHKQRRQKHRSWDEDDVSELVYNRRYQAWADRNAREAEEENAAAAGGAEGAASTQACVDSPGPCARGGPMSRNKPVPCGQLRSQVQPLSCIVQGR